MYCLFCDVLCIVCAYMCTELLPPGGYPIAVKYIIIIIILTGLRSKPGLRDERPATNHLNRLMAFSIILFKSHVTEQTVSNLPVMQINCVMFARIMQRNSDGSNNFSH